MNRFTTIVTCCCYSPVSVSQQSSPRRSLIPQPTRQRSTSLSKSTERLSSPKFGRRTDSRGRLTDSRSRLNASGNSSSVASLASRRQAAKTPSKLSPIQGTPTKPERTPTQFGAKRDRSGGKESTPARQQKFAVSPSRHNAWNAKKQSQERVPVSGKAGGSKERVTSPSKIPLKTNRVGSNSLNPSRFISISNQPKGKKAVDKGGSKGVSASDERVNESGQDGGKRSETGWKEPRGSEKSSSVEQIPDLHLIDLLKQTSTATGTSSVVSTTATTAVQPLHIDANAILLDKDGLEKKNLAEERSRSQQSSLSNDNKSSNSPNADDSASKQTHNNSQLVGCGEDHHHRRTNSQISRSNKSNGNYNRTKGGTEGRNDSPIPNDAVNNHSKSNGTGQSARSKGNGTVTGNADPATQRSNDKIQMNNAINDPNAKNSRPSDAKIVEGSVTVSNSAKTNEVESSKDSTRNSSSAERVASVTGGSVKQEEARTISRSSNNSGTRVAANAVIVKTTPVSDRSSMSSKANNNALASNDAKKVNSAAGGKVGNEGSGTSLKSSGGMSVDSIESVRSTDTGVSVDTVRGVSSPREKTGMHVVKRPQEIETLSGNVVHLEQNGEPA